MWGRREKNTETRLAWRGLDVRVLHKPNRHSYLRIRTPSADVEVSAPLEMPLSAIVALLDERAQWIDHQRKRILAAGQQPPKRFVDGASILLFGIPHPLRVFSDAKFPGVELADGEIRMRTREHASADERARLLQGFYRDQLAQRIALLVQRYRQRLGLAELRWQIRSMRTRWGSCSTRTRRISLNLELVHYPESCLEYVVVHELVHFHERYHNARFYSLVESVLPQWEYAHTRLRKRYDAEL